MFLKTTPASALFVNCVYQAMDTITFSLFILILWREIIFVEGIKFDADTFSGASVLAKEGKMHLESLSEKITIPQHGACWKNAISELQVGCKFLSENVQKDLALKFTDCFLQMSGYEPLKCDFPKNTCPQKLSDRAFNAYTEFYTHTQSICYFLQNQQWQEEAEKTVNKLTTASQHVSKQLEEAEKAQQKLLYNQKESLTLQNILLENSKLISTTMKLSQDKINLIISDFQNSATEQKELLLDVFENLLSLKSWAVNEMSWFESVAFYISAIVIGLIFTSIGRIKSARIYIFLIFTLNYLLERYISSLMLSNKISKKDGVTSSNTLNSWIWICRKCGTFMSGIIMLFMALNHNDYNILNYKLLLEIKDQNKKIIENFNSKFYNYETFSNRNTFNPNVEVFDKEKTYNSNLCFMRCPENLSYKNTTEKQLCKGLNLKTVPNFSLSGIDDTDQVQSILGRPSMAEDIQIKEIIPDKSETKSDKPANKSITHAVKKSYNLRRNRPDKKLNICLYSNA